MRAVSLFSGVGGFELGFDRAGIQTVLQVERDPWCTSVLERHWPEVERLDDVRKVGQRADGSTSESERRGIRLKRDAADPRDRNGRHEPADDIDLVYGGFPCQDVSVAGKRAGLSGERSGLWFEFERILRELRPTWAVIENVPGLLSSHYGRDFHRILLGLVDLGYGVAWRVVDARWFGVPQRRRRVFIVGCLGDARRAAQVLAVCESCGGYSAAGSQTREDVARTLDDGARRASVELPMIAASLSAGGHPESNMPGRHHEDDDNLVIGSGIDEGMARSLLSRSTGYRMDLESENFVVTNALDGGERGFAPRGDGADNLIAFQPNSSRTDEEWRENETPPVKKGSGGLGAVPPAFAGPQGVRRLTPLECERLQGWPDDWTRWAADGRELSDSHRYRLCGNGVVAPVAEYIGHRLVEVSR